MVLGLLPACEKSEEHTEVEMPSESPFLNLHDSVKYVGMSTCRQCHSDIHSTFMHTGMGQSFASASRQKSVADFNAHKPIFDQRFNYYYYPYWAGDSLYVREFRMEGRDTIHKLEQRIDYIIGSGQHTNSHLFSENGYLYQAPFTWYAQKRKWDLPPGFDEGAVTRFSRMISLECMSCHNAYPDFVAGSENRFRSILQGIDCERCHGPGSLHVQEKQAGKIIDTSKYTDYTIVNPKKLPLDLQMEICQRCHLQGNAVLKPGKSFFDFKPGMRLREVFDVFMPKYEGDDRRFIMASHVERLKMSPCYQHSNDALNCISCHNPHISVKVTGTEVFNNTCKNCHGQTVNSMCTESEHKRKEKSDNCVQCHMPKSGTEDIPHVTTHDHYIRKPVKQGNMPDGRTFAGLVCLTDPNPGPLVKAKAWLQYFEKFDGNRVHLDSAAYWLSQSPNSAEKLKAEIHLYYMLQDFTKLTGASDRLASDVKASADGWTCYRMGEGFMQINKPQQAEPFFEKAVHALPHAPEFSNKLAVAYIANGKTSEAQKVLVQIVRDVPKYAPALNNLGFLYLQAGKSQAALTLLKRALALDPDYEKALQNLSKWHIQYGTRAEAIQQCEQLMQKFPGRPEYSKLLQEAIRKR